MVKIYYKSQPKALRISLHLQTVDLCTQFSNKNQSQIPLEFIILLCKLADFTSSICFTENKTNRKPSNCVLHLVETERHVFNCSLVFKIHLLVCFYFKSSFANKQKILIILFCFIISLGNYFSGFFFLSHWELFSLITKARFKLFFITSKCHIHSIVDLTRRLSTAASQQAVKQQLDLHRFNKLAIYRLMFLSLNHVPSLTILVSLTKRPVTFNLFP